MAKVAPPGSLSSASFQIGAMKVGSAVKRKTPSELRGEQLRRTNAVEILDESPASMLGSASEVNNGLKKVELSRNPRYIDTRMDEVYPAKKSRLRVSSGKENTKETASVEQPSLKNLSLLSDLAAKRRHQLARPETVVDSAKAAKDGGVQVCKTIERCSQSTFRSVSELSLGDERSSDNLGVDMDKALRGLVARESSDISGVPAFSFGGCADLTLSSISSFCLRGQKAPLDFTLKTCMRVQSSSSVSWINRSIVSQTSTAMPFFTSQLRLSGNHNRKEDSGVMSPSQALSSKILHSWVYPQSTLPPSVISVLTSSAVDRVEMDFLRRRQVAWEDSFRSLYYMLRHSICNIFYVCTAHFVVMFTGHDGFEGTKRLCNAYVSKSTRGLRALLKEHDEDLVRAFAVIACTGLHDLLPSRVPQDVNFCMPLCRSKIEQATTEDLVELSEIEKQNLGQTRRQSSLSDIDNSPESLIAFYGNMDVHGLYEILLNYRSLLTALAGMDVPVLLSPKPFQNAALSAPEIKCMELKRAEHVAFPDKESIMKEGEPQQGSSYDLCSSVEIKDAYLPPWVICSLCALLSSEGKSFEASFTTEATSVSLNAAVEAVSEKSDVEDVANEGNYAFDIPEAVVTPYLRSSSLKGLKYLDASYVATLSPV